MRFTAEELLSYLLEATPCSTSRAPRDSRGLYGLVDHHGDLRYIGSTSSTDQTLYERIHQRHRTGSEGMSHYFSQMYNTGRMWRDRKNPITKTDGDIAKTLRNEFIVDHCRAVWLQLPDTLDIAALEAEVLSLAPSHAIAWNRRGMLPYDEPVHLVEATLSRLRWGTRERDAIERQRERFLATMTDRVAAPILTTATAGQIYVTPFPKGPFCSLRWTSRLRPTIAAASAKSALLACVPIILSKFGLPMSIRKWTGGCSPIYTGSVRAWCEALQPFLTCCLS